MKHRSTLIFSYLPLLLLFASCSAELDAPRPFSGELSFGKYIAVGDGFTAGFMNGGLYREGQELSYPNLLVQQFRLINDIPFNQPLLPENGTGYLKLDSLLRQACDLVPPEPQVHKVPPSPHWKVTLETRPPFHNLAIPGLKIEQTLSATLHLENPFFRNMAQVPDTGGMAYDDWLARAKTDFFTLWLGTENVLNYALKGGESPGSELIKPDSFAYFFNQSLQALLAQDPSTPGLVANIPDVSHFPYFNTVGYLWVNRENCSGSTQPIYIQTSAGVRTAKAHERILLIADSLIHYQQLGLSAARPLPGNYVLDESELLYLRQMTQAYNEQIRLLVEAHNAHLPKARIALVDMYHELGLANESGLVVDGVPITAEYITGGMYSLDGIYPTPRGNAFIANIFIARINAFFKAAIPTINITDYNGVEFP
ncbi:MAG: hypothetical protein D6730_06380 [Bacteroidetes bacterium]|nr:MAG: hypothetical protein D6730_06380 [Bacteroidota bacterium]